MILWKNNALGQAVNQTFGNPYSLFPLGQIKPPDPTPVDNQADRTTWAYNPNRNWLPGYVPVISPENPVPIVPQIGNRIGYQEVSQWRP